MNLPSLPRVAAVWAALLALTWPASAATTLPAAAAGPAGSGTVPGFLLRVAQAPADAAIGAGFTRALRQINGTLTDDGGNAVTNEALPGPNLDGSYTADLVNFEREGLQVDVTDMDLNLLASFFAVPFPGIPGASAHTDKFAVEVVAFLELPAGDTTFGVSVGTDRTDVNDDDNYQAFVGLSPQDFFGTKVGEFQRNAPPFQQNTRNENQWTVTAPVAGVYPFRLLYWQGGRGANLNWYTVAADGERILVNDTANPRAVRAFTRSSVARTGAPYVGEVAPLPGSAGNSPSAAITASLFDGADALNDASVKLFLNGAAVSPARQRTGRRVDLSFSPDPLRTSPDNLVRIEFAATGGAAYTNTWSFTITAVAGGAAPVTGQWDFDAGDLSATVGTPLAYLDGPAGVTAAGTQFGTTGQGDFAAIPDIGGRPAKIMRVPGDLTRSIGYLMTHGIAPNGGGTRVNQFTLIMDVFVAEAGPGAASLAQYSSVPDNTDDGDLFWQGSNFGQGTDGYRGRGTFTAGAWHRVVAAYDMAANPPVVTKYVDGIKQDDWTAGAALDAPRRTLGPQAILFADGDQDERREMWVSSVQIRSGKLTDAQAAALGGPTAGGIPIATPQSTVTGQWDFEFGDLGATIGRNLAYLDGAGGQTETGTRFGVTGQEDFAEVPLIGGEAAGVMYVPGDLSRNIGYLMEHLIPPNGGGTRVNQFTLVLDVLISASGPGAASLAQFSSVPDNTDDGDLFWQGNNFGQGTDGYRGTGIFTPGEWHRVVAAYDMAATPPVVVKYVDGVFQDDWTTGAALDAPRRTMGPQAILFADGDQDERREWWVSAVQVRAGALSKPEIEALGGPSAAGIPIVIAVAAPAAPPALGIARSGSSVTISWPPEVAGFTLEGAAALPGGWSPVPGVQNNSVTVPAGTGAQYFRLRQ